MQLAPTPVTQSAGPPADWAPTRLQVVPSTFGDSAFRSIVGVWRGQREPVAGQALTGAQQRLLAPHLSTHLRQPIAAVRDALAGVRLYVGGPPAAFGVGATVLADRIYLKDAQTLERIMSWDGRRFLAHEAAHVIQRLDASDRLSGMLGGGELGRDRAALLRYVAGSPGASAKGALAWLRHQFDKDGGTSADKAALADLTHDAHRLERQAEDIGVAFRDATR
jgi:hypothetical protein